MTPSTPLGPLGRRLLAAFVLVALAAVGLVAGAGLVGSSLGLTRSEQSARDAAAARAADLAGQAYRLAGGWGSADLAGPASVATAAGARLVVLDAAGTQVAAAGTGMGMGNGNGMGNGMGMGNGAGMGTGAMTGVGADAVRATADVVVDGTRVGAVVLGFGRVVDSGSRTLAWSWILAAAVLAALVAAVAGRFVVRSLTRPLAALTEATRAFGAGQRDARPGTRWPGELGELARAFDEAADAVQRAERERRQMAADVAHELRTPVSALQAGLEELRDGLVEPDPQTLTRLHDQVLRLSRSVGELSELSAAEAAAGELHPVETDLSGVVRAAVEARSPQLRAADLEVSTEVADGVLALADADRIHQVVGNLLDNCARHCRPGDHVTVALAAVGDVARLTVSDTGPGIPPADLSQVTQRFWRGRDRDAVQGSGVGLAVVARLVEAHRGRLRVTSDGMSGTTVTVELPLAREPVAPRG